MPDDRRADVVVPVYHDAEMTRACLEAVLARSGDALGRLVVVNDRSPDARMRATLERIADRSARVAILENEANLGFVRSANRGLLVRTGDVVVLNSDTLVTDGWLRELLAVAYASDRIASVAPLSNAATVNSIPRFCEDMPVETLPDAPAWVATSPLPRWTEAPVAVGFCVLLKDAVLRMIGPFDEAFGRGYEEENDWAARARRCGLVSARANRAFVYHLGSSSFGVERNALQRRNGRLLAARHRTFLDAVGAFAASAPGRIAAHWARARLGDRRAAIDLRHLPPEPNGTGVYALELAAALAAEGTFRISAVVATRGQARAVEARGIPVRLAARGAGSVQIVHRPAQVFDPAHLPLLLDGPALSVITYQDLITFRSPIAADDLAAHQRYRATSWASLRAAQAVIAPSEHTRAEIVSELGVPADRVRAVPHGVDAARFALRDPRANAARLGALGVRPPYVLYVGTDFPHKNLRSLVAGHAVLRARWQGPGAPPALVLAGAATRTAGSVYGVPPDRWPPGVRYVGAVDDAVLLALYQEARAFAFLSSYEGFGLPLLEAMASGVPVVCARATSVPEVAGDAALYVETFDREEIAARLRDACGDGPVRARAIEAGLRRAASFTWRETARRTVEVYLEAIERPPAASLIDREHLAALLAG